MVCSILDEPPEQLRERQGEPRQDVVTSQDPAEFQRLDGPIGAEDEDPAPPRLDQPPQPDAVPNAACELGPEILERLAGREDLDRQVGGEQDVVDQPAVLVLGDSPRAKNARSGTIDWPPKVQRSSG